MKASHLLCLCAAVLAFGGCEQPPLPTRWQTVPEIEMDFLVVRLSEKRALPLVPRLRNPQQAADAAKETLHLIEKGEAELLGWPFLSTKDGERAVVEQIDEFRYATEYEPPHATRKPRPDPRAGSIPAGSDDPATTTVELIDGAMPGDYETRNIGITLEAEPIIAPDGHTIDLSLVAQHSWLKGMRKSSVEGWEPGRKIVVEQPEFVTNKVSTHLTIQDGDYALGVFKIPDLPDQMELFILHTRLKRVPAPAKAPPGPSAKN